jgi:hypothetical protein
VRKRKKLLKVVVAAALLIVAVPSAALAYPLSDDVGRAGAPSENAGCSVDPRLLRMEPELCSNEQVTTYQGMAESDPVPAPTNDTEIAMGWWIVAIAATAGVAGAIAGMLRHRPQALS